MNIHYLTAITPNEPYLTYSKALVESFKKLNLEIEVVTYPNRLSWVKNTHEKPKIIRRMLNSYEKVVWFDADSVLLRHPAFFDNIQQEIGLHTHTRPRNPDTKYIMSAIMYFTNSKRCLDLLDAWIAACKDNYQNSDDQVLDKVLQDHFKFSEIAYIPKEYCKLDDRYFEVKEPVVQQYRASTTKQETLPNSVRLVADGTYRLIRENAVSRQYLDDNFDRVDDKTWKPRFKDVKANIKNLCIDNPVVNIIGKGPSLDGLLDQDTSTILLDVPTLCINDSVRVLEELNYKYLYCVVQDPLGLGTYEPKYADIICSQHAFARYSKLSVNCFSYGNKIGSDYSLPINEHTPTVVVALILAKIMGANTCRMFAFDSITDKNYTYSKLVETTKEVNTNLMNHQQTILNAVKSLNLTLEWIKSPSLE